MFIYPSTVRSAIMPIIGVICSFFGKAFLYTMSTTLLIYGADLYLRRNRPETHEGQNRTAALCISAVWCIIGMPLLLIYGEGSDVLDAIVCHWNVLLAVFVFVMARKQIQERRPDFRYAVYVVILLFIAANFTSQGIQGSTYGLYPFFMILAAILFREKVFRKGMAVTLALCMSVSLLYADVTNARLSYVSLFEKSESTTSQEKLYPLSAKGHFLEEFDELTAWVNQNVAEDETIYAVPGEDPLYFATGRMPQLSYFQLNETTFPYDLETIADACIENRITYLIVKKHLQCTGGFIRYAPILEMISDDYVLCDSLTGYDIYQIQDGRDHADP